MSTKPPRPGQPVGPGAARPSSSSKVVWIVVIAVLAAVLAAVVIAVVAAGGGDDDGGSTGTTSASGAGPIVNGTVRVEGTDLPQSDDLTKDDPAVGQAFPTIVGQDVLTGEPLEINPGDGKAKVIIGIAHWCPHCQREVPEIQKWLDDNGMPEGVELYAISTAVAKDRGNWPPATWLAKEGWQVPTMADSIDNDAAAAAGVSAFPYFVAVDSNGEVVQRGSGELSMDAFAALIAKARG